MLVEEGMLEQASCLITALEEGDQSKAMNIVDDLTRLRERDLFREIGRMTRQLHDALIGLHMDSKIINLTLEEVPDAKERLAHVLSMTENAAHRTMTLVEDMMPVCDAMESGVDDVKSRYKDIGCKRHTKEQLQAVADDLNEYFRKQSAGARKISAALRDILIVQEYQDLVGQTIKRVIGLVQEVENSLVGMIRASGSSIRMKDIGKADRKSESITSQDDVDDLLSSMGF